MMGEPEVVVRADHDLPIAADARFRRGRLLNRMVARVSAAGFSVLGDGEQWALVENAHSRAQRERGAQRELSRSDDYRGVARAPRQLAPARKNLVRDFSDA